MAAEFANKRFFSPLRAPERGTGADAERHALSVHKLAWDALARLANTRAAERLPDTQRDDVPVIAFCDSLVAGDTSTARALVQDALDEEVSYQTIADSLFAEAARRLGSLWETDVLGFADVSLGISTLLRVNAWLRRELPLHLPETAGDVLFATLPHQAHTLGIILATEAFRQQNIDVDLLLGSEEREIVARASRDGVRLVGLTAGHDNRISDIASLTRALKALPDAPHVVLGGAITGRDRTLLEDAQIDETVSSIADALAVASRALPGR